MLLDHLKSNINSDHENDVDSDKTLVSSSVQSSPKRKLEEEEKDDKDDKKKVKVSESLAECPICEKFMDSTFLQTTHIDACLSGKTILPKTSSVPKKTKTNISSFFKSKEPKKVDHEDFYFNQVEKHVQSINRLPKLDFKSLTTPKLKEKLSSVNLSTNGTRNQLELRYNQYYILFNSNLDSNHPVDTRTLKQQLMSWESSHSAFNSKSVTSLFTKNTTKSIIDKNFSVRLWKRMYHMEFKELIEQAKKNIKITKEIEPEFKTNSIFIGDED
ncbi:hypothetical protein CLIB1444_01S10506 [[Candida] jaroonii]|uniref:Uncharacterized protein n=1 Tax=[Candida] jaroonii TaxID=467808 RepID=A0ACA9Y1E7_9ASCO|nr:hypothetical protein CLIB1444_01S10506 [[Candida] jaroonii]